jgi:cation diffusion facilitator family transporter
MQQSPHPPKPSLHGPSHVFLGAEHTENERRTWAVIALTTAMMLAEIIGGWLWGSLAVLADGLHMATHVGALLLSALAYTLARRWAGDARFSFGTGKLGDLAGYTSALVLAGIAVIIAGEAIARLFHPVPIAYPEAMTLAALGVFVNLGSVWLLGGGHRHRHGHGHGHEGGDDHRHAQAGQNDAALHRVQRDHALRSAILHVSADAAVSFFVFVALVLARAFGWSFLDPVVGFLGASVIAQWALSLMRDTGAVLLDMTPDPQLARALRTAIEAEGDEIADFHLWRLGPGHLGAIVMVGTKSEREAADYHAKLAHIPGLSHLTVEVRRLS